MSEPAKWISKWRGHGTLDALEWLKQYNFDHNDSLLMASALKVFLAFLAFLCFLFFSLLRKKVRGP